MIRSARPLRNRCREGETVHLRIPAMLTAEETTTLLRDVRRGSGDSRLRLQDGLYQELRAVAEAIMRGRSAGQTLQPTALVHEAWMKLAASEAADPNDRAHFMAIAATAMRQILVDHARGRAAIKRGGGARRLSIDDFDAPDRVAAPDQVLIIDECLRRLARLDPRQAQVVEMRVFSGMTVEEVATALSMSTRTVELDWRMARAWLADELGHDHE